MAIQILLPALSPTMTCGNIIQWLKQAGDKIRPGDVLLEIETDKAIMEVEASDGGFLGKITMDGGSQDVLVGTCIGFIVKSMDEIIDDSTNESINGIISENTGKGISTPSTPCASPSKINTLGATQKLDSHESAKQNRILASPLARRIAEHHHLDLAVMQGSGPNGRIIRRDIAEFLQQQAIKKQQNIQEGGPGESESYAQGGAPGYLDQGAAMLLNVSSAATSSSSAFSTTQDTTTRAAGATISKPTSSRGVDEVVVISNMRKQIAQRLLWAKQNIPHFYVSIDVQMDEALSYRERLNQIQAITRISINDMWIVACGRALEQMPEFNLSWQSNNLTHDNNLIKNSNVDVCVAVSIPEGLITPIIFDVPHKSLINISMEAKELIQRAKDRKLKPAEFTGGSFSISNLGMFGVNHFSAIINPPQTSILAIGGLQNRLALNKQQQVTSEQFSTVTISIDHRALDGVIAAQFLAKVKQIMENPLHLLI